jgi:hypothetical protein
LGPSPRTYCQNAAVHQSLQALAVALFEPHHVGVDAERDGHVGVAGVLGDRRRIVPERDAQG